MRIPAFIFIAYFMCGCATSTINRYSVSRTQFSHVTHLERVMDDSLELTGSVSVEKGDKKSSSSAIMKLDHTEVLKMIEALPRGVAYEHRENRNNKLVRVIRIGEYEVSDSTPEIIKEEVSKSSNDELYCDYVYCGEDVMLLFDIATFDIHSLKQRDLWAYPALLVAVPVDVVTFPLQILISAILMANTDTLVREGYKLPD